MEEYVDRAVALGFREIGFSDHMPVMPEPELCMSNAELPVYLARVRELRDRYRGRIDIRVGCEMDIVPGREDEIRGIIERSGFDYVIGSIHYLEGWPFDQKQYRDLFEKGDMNEIYGRFFDSLVRAARSGLYDIAGHADNIKRMGYRPEGDLTPLYERAAAVFREMNVAVELNTSGFDYPAGEAYPSPGFLRILNSHGVPVTTGSDSHKPEHIGRYFDRAEGILRDAGYDRVARFQGRERTLTLLSFADDGAAR
jgi:histidinol-phosphatase (PHP family)